MFGFPVLSNSNDGRNKMVKGKKTEMSTGSDHRGSLYLVFSSDRKRYSKDPFLSFPFLLVSLPNHYLFSNEPLGGSRASLRWHTLRGTLQYSLRCSWGQCIRSKEAGSGGSLSHRSRGEMVTLPMRKEGGAWCDVQENRMWQRRGQAAAFLYLF